jgi:hypothetical protein
MKSTFRQEVKDFIRSCETLADFSHEAGLTHEEREAVHNFTTGLAKEVVPLHPHVDEETPLAPTHPTFP